ncbi:MAG: hypothetical protein ACI4CS_02230 [Candidatus Weimeria sp.]
MSEIQTQRPYWDGDPTSLAPLWGGVIDCSICNGEQVAGFKDLETGRFEEVMFIRNADDLDEFRKEYGITGEIEKEY